MSIKINFKHMLRFFRVFRNCRTYFDKRMSLKNDENFHRLLVPAVKDLRDLFRSEGFELRMAGGAPRDLLLNILPHDVDFDKVRNLDLS